MTDPHIIPLRRRGAITFAEDLGRATIHVFHPEPRTPPTHVVRWFCAGRSGDVEVDYYDPFRMTDQVVAAVDAVLGPPVPVRRGPVAFPLDRAFLRS